MCCAALQGDPVLVAACEGQGKCCVQSTRNSNSNGLFIQQVGEEGAKVEGVFLV
jgi:hypothetical protein